MSTSMEAEAVDGGGSGVAADFHIIPEDCIGKVISFTTTPYDASRLSLVSKYFKSAADSDAIWERFLPAGYRSLVWPASLNWPKKELYLDICDRPVLIEEGKKSFSMEKRTGKKCYMLGPRDLVILGVNYPIYWDWICFPASRFRDTPQLINVSFRFGIRGTIGTQMLSEGTLYAACFVFKSWNTDRFENPDVQVAVGPLGGHGFKKNVLMDLDYRDRNIPQPNIIRPPRRVKERRDGWLELELGVFYNNGDMVVELEMSLLEASYGRWKAGLILQGIEIRPK